ncbi:MAG: DUF1573 domain-containing protein [Candidatus Taylorbacteria bacterium]|nr:DUF1573 domain-containing protein [Candidatus Taylorbacteria bacterium]
METNKSTIISVIATVVVVIGGMFWLGMSSAGSRATLVPEKTSTEGSALRSAESAFDFGTISMKDGNVETVFTVTNSTSTDITVSKVTTSCMCTQAYVEGPTEKKGPFGMEGMGLRNSSISQTLKPGESIDVRVIYDPNAHGPAGVGNINRAVFIQDSGGRTLTLSIKAQVIP